MLRSFQRLGLSLCNVVPRSVSSRALEVMLNTIPLHLQLLKDGLCTYVRLHRLLPLEWSGISHTKHHNISHRLFWAKLLSDNNLEHLLGVYDYTLEATPEQVFVTRISDGIFRDPGPGLMAFTDGSKDRDRVGAGLVILEQGKRIHEEMARLPDLCSVFQAELYAILMAAKYFNTQPLLQTPYIFSDSQAALKALSGDEICSQLVLDTVAELNLIGDIQLGWVRGHASCRGNLMADRVAKTAGQLPVVTQILPLPRCEIKKQILSWLHRRWNQEWESYPLARQTKTFFPAIDFKKSQQILQLGRKPLGRFIRLVTGHCSLRSHCHRVNQDENEMCRLCGADPETFLHFLMDCPSLIDARRDVFEGDAWLTDAGWDLDKLLKFSYHPMIKPLFLRSSQRVVAVDADQDATTMDVDGDLSSSGSDSPGSSGLD